MESIIRVRTLLRALSISPVLAVVLASATPVLGQGVQTGTLSGVVESADGQPLPGVTVEATSPSLQGASSAVSDANGVYFLRGLAPGTYTLTYQIPSFRTVTRGGVAVTSGGLAKVDVTLALAALTETVTVTAQTPSVVASARTSQTYSKNDIDLLPVGRRPFDIGELAPGVTTNAVSAVQLTLGGSFGFDNVFMVNGVDVNDTVNGSANNLFIEDAIEETTVLTHGIPAEYGRFSGGVVNIVTRSGGNIFSGSFREGLSNPKWIGQTPLEEVAGIKHLDILGKTHEGTFGGPVVRDRVWFFSAGRYEKTSTANTFAQNGTAYTRTDTNRRGELKVTATVTPGQRLQASFIANATEQANASALNAATLLDAGMLTTRELPNRMLAVNYNAGLSQALFVSAQYSEKKQGFRNNGGTSSVIEDSPFLTLGATPGVPASLFYNAPYFDATDPEDRNNRQLTGSLAYLVPTDGLGTHEFKTGAEHFIGTGIGGNSQSSTGYVFATDYLVGPSGIVRDATGTPIPVFTPGVSQAWNFRPVRGAKVDLKTTSWFVQDRWVVTRNLTLDLGTRVEMVRTDSTGGGSSISASTIVPRLAATYDPIGDGRTVLFGTYGHYSGKYGQVQFGVHTNVGRPDEVDYVYSGPAGQGSDFKPGFDLANYRQVSFANFPTANVQLADDLRSPITKELTAGLGREFADRGHARFTYIWRRASDFVEDFVDLSRGVTDVPLVGPLTNRVFENTDALEREYQAVIIQSGYRFGSSLKVDGHYTGQLRNHGTFAGEAANQPGIPSMYGNFPEIFGPANDRLVPDGRLDNFLRHKLRVYGTYTQSIGRAGSIDVSPLWRVNSGAVYNLTAGIRIPASQLARNPGYPTNDISAATRETVFFGERGAEDYKGYGVLDLALSYNLNVWRTLRPWFKAEFYNLLENQKLIAWDRTVSANAAGPLDANGIPTEYVKGPRFGQGTSGAHYPQPYLGQPGGRAFRMAFGVRF
ncbi:MAG: TonB-dependent receptor [Acidobacteria bacterium]|nr:TonB-dependent receptor [Acidobacteriota bacterium]